MKLTGFVFMFFLLFVGCSQKAGNQDAIKTGPAESETRAADEASLLAAAKEAGVSDEEALAAKAEIDKVYDEASAKMDAAEAERLARMKQLKDESCIEDCSGD